MPPRSRPDYYEILGLAQTASADDIRKRFRELARRYHPDVAEAPDAGARFREINEAHQVLGDPDKRAAYDAERKLARGRRAGEGERPDAREPAAGPAAARPAPRPQRTPPASAEPLVARAERAFGRLRYREAEILCRQALRIDRRYVRAYEILGDICRARGRADEAIAMYSYALQLDKANRSVQEKFDRLVGRPSGPTMAGNAARAAAHAPRAAGPSSLEPARLTPTRALVTGVGAALLVFLVFVLRSIGNPPATSFLFVHWDPLAVFTLAAAGALCGFLLALNSLLASARDVLAPSGFASRRRFTVPPGAILVFFSLISVYAGFAVYMILCFLEETVNRSILTAFAASVAIALVFALAAPVGGLYIVASGGNVVLPAFVGGWLVGEAFSLS